MYRTIIIALTMLCIPLSPLYAVDEDGGTSSPFELGAGGRSISMGGAAAAVWGDSYSLIWNPAGLYEVERIEADLFHTTLFDESTGYSSILLSYPFLDLGVISIGAVQLRIGGIEKRDHENRLIGGELKNTQTRYYLSYARKIFGGLTGGANFKLDRYTLGGYAANGFGMDIGFGVKPPVKSPVFDGMALGLAVTNVLEPKINLVAEEVGDPMGVRFGFSVWRPVCRKAEDRLLLAVDFDKTRYSDIHVHFGGEYSLKSFFAVRCGWDEGIPTFGCGISVRSIIFDYACRSTDLGSNHLFSLMYRFGSSRTSRKEGREKMRETEIRRELETYIDHFEGDFVQTSLDSGDECIERGDYPAALDHYRKVLLWAPDNERAGKGMLMTRTSLLVARGDSLMNSGNLADALFSYREAYKHLVVPEIKDRIDICERRIAEARDREQVIENILSGALELYTERDWFGAAKGFEKVLDLDSGHGTAVGYLRKTRDRIAEQRRRILSRVDRFISAKQYGAALTELRAGLNVYPADSEFKTRMDSVTELQRQEGAAKRDAAGRAAPKQTLSRGEIEELRRLYQRGVRYFKDGEFARAIDEWTQVWRKSSSFEKVDQYLIKAGQYLGMELYVQHRYQEALEIWQKILEVDPDNEKAIRYINRTREELAGLEGLSR